LVGFMSMIKFAMMPHAACMYFSISYSGKWSSTVFSCMSYAHTQLTWLWQPVRGIKLQVGVYRFSITICGYQESVNCPVVRVLHLEIADWQTAYLARSDPPPVQA